jgi:hypothetical protein
VLWRLLAPTGEPEPGGATPTGEASQDDGASQVRCADVGCCARAWTLTHSAQESGAVAGWLWVCAASQASLKPRSPEAQHAAKRCARSRALARDATRHALIRARASYATLRHGRLVLTLSANGDEPVEVDLSGCDVFAAPGASLLRVRHVLRASQTR